MSDFIEQAILPYNLPLTVLMGLVALFWVLSLLGAVDVDVFDLDVDADSDVEPQGSDFIGTVLKVVNAQDVPVMMVLSIFILLMWVISILSNYTLNPLQSHMIAFGLGGGNFLVSIIGVKLITQPLRPLFRSIKEDEASAPLVGSIGKVKSKGIDESYGQVEVQRDGGAPALLNAKLTTGSLERGADVLVLSYDDESKRYVVKAAPELFLSDS